MVKLIAGMAVVTLITALAVVLSNMRIRILQRDIELQKVRK